jgi:hypothetical protein
MIRWLYLRWMNRHDPAWSSTGVKPSNGPYDYQKARAGWLKAQQHTASGRPLVQPGARQAATVTPIRKVQP